MMLNKLRDTINFMVHGYLLLGRLLRIVERCLRTRRNTVPHMESHMPNLQESSLETGEHPPIRPTSGERHRSLHSD